MRRGEVRHADLTPARGSEADKRRPVVVVSNDGANQRAARSGQGVVTVVPVTSNTTRLYSFQVLLPVLGSGSSTHSKAQAEQVRSIDVQRLGPPLGMLPLQTMNQIDEALRLHLQL